MESEPLLSSPREDGASTRGKSGIWNLILGNLVVFLHYVAANIQSPVLGRYLYERISEEVLGNRTVIFHFNQTCYQNRTDPNYILQEEIQKKNADIEMQFKITKCVLAIFSNILLGAYSDSLGRRFLFGIPLFGHVLRYTISTCIIAWQLDLNFFFLADAVDGLMGSYFAFLMASYTYTADNTPASGSRTVGLAVLDISIIFGSSVQLGTGLFIQYEGLLYPSIVASGLSLVVAILGLFLPERENSTRREMVCLGPLEILKRVFGFYILDGSWSKRGSYVLVVVIFILTFICGVGSGGIDYLYKVNEPFCWDPKRIGYYATAGALSMQLVGVPVLRLLQCCIMDDVIAVVGSLAFAASYVLEGLAYNDAMMYGVFAIQVLSVGVFPVLFCLLSKMAPANRQASLFASIAVVEAISSLAATPIFSIIYQKTVMLTRGTDFFIIAGVHVVAALLLIVYINVSKPERRVRFAEEREGLRYT